MDKQKNNTRADRPAGGSPGSFQPKRSSNARRPSGFGTAGQAPKAKPAPEAPSKRELKEMRKLEKRAKKEEKRQKKEYIGREPGKNRPVLRVLLAILAVLLLAFIIIVIIFGGEDKTYHQMPVIERESVAEFSPEESSAPGLEGL